MKKFNLSTKTVKAILGVLIVALSVISIFSYFNKSDDGEGFELPKARVCVNKYITFECGGYDGHGTCTYSVDYAAIEKIKDEEVRNDVYLVCSLINFDKQIGLQNGDKVKMYVNYDDIAKNAYFKEDTFKVSGLVELSQ